MKTQENKNSDNISLYLMEVQDIKEVVQIQTESGLSHWTYIDYVKEIESADSISIVAKFEDEIIVGFAVVKLLAEENADSKNIHGSSEIYNIAVKNEFQGKGIGQRIFDRIVKELRDKNVSDIWLEVRESNANALKFYRKNGFSKQFVRKNYYTNPLEDALILKLSLDHKNQT